jgi:uncharacterized protein
LELTKLTGQARSEAERLAEEIVLALSAAVGQSEEEIVERLAEIERPAGAEKLFAGLAKVVQDACEFEAPLELDAAELRSRVFQLAAERRRNQEDGGFDRDLVLAEVAEERGISAAAVEQALFSDLRGARLLVQGPGFGAEDVLARYEVGQIQGVLLRAVRITLEVECVSPDAYRAFFRKLKFRRLLHRIEPRAAGGYRIEIDGPLCLFESVTKYGLSLAQLVPTLRECQKVDLVAELRWGKARDALDFAVSFAGAAALGPAPVRDEVAAVVEAVQRLNDGWTAELASELFDVPGVGVVVPDLLLRDPAGRTVHVEVMGYWSREAVFRRLDWLAARAASPGKQVRLLLAVSSQLRVSPDAMPADAHGAIYVYKGAILARALLEQARALSESTA